MMDEIWTKMEQDEVAIRNLQKKATDLISQLKFYRNEFCMKCGNYKESHNGACDGCYFKDEWRKDVQWP